MTKPLKTEEVLKLGKLYRTAKIERVDAESDEDRSIELAFSSEAPYERFFGVEILDHKKKSIRMDFINGGTAPLLPDHRASVLLQLGVVESVKVDSDKVARAIVRFGTDEQADLVWRKVQDGIVKNVSVGYRVHKMVLEEAGEDVPRTYRVTDWEPLEISLVAIPADQTVGIGKSGDDMNEVSVVNPFTEHREDDMPEKDDIKKKGETDATPAGSTTISDADMAKRRDDAIKAEDERVKEITAIGQRHNLQELAREHVRAGTALSVFRGLALNKIDPDKPLDTPRGDIGLEKKDVKKYSLLRAINAMAEKDWTLAPLEYEAHKELVKKTGKAANGMYVPDDVLADPDFIKTRNERLIQQMLLRVVSSGGTGANLIGTDHLAGSFIELLRNRMVLGQVGARFLRGLTGDVDIPKQTGGATFGMIDNETQTVTGSDQAYGSVSMSPKTGSAKTQVTRKMRLQSSPDVEMLTRNDLITTIGLGWDDQGFNGDGTGANVNGVRNVAGIGDVPGGVNGLAPNWDHIVDLETEVAVDNADVGSLAYVTNPKVRGTLKKTAIEAGDAQRVWDRNADPLNGYRAVVSNQVPSNLTKGTGTDLSVIMFGNWNDVLVGQWGVLDIKVDDITSDAGALILKAFQDFDIAVRHPESFAAMQDAITA